MTIGLPMLTFFLTTFSDVSIGEGSETRLPPLFRTEKRFDMQFNACFICV